MKKTLLTLASLLAVSALSHATVTYQFSSTSVFATNWQNGVGATNGTLVWGIVVDSAGDGFAGTNALTPYTPGFAYSATTTLNGLALTTGLPGNTTATDDVLYISSNLMNLTTNTNDGAVAGLNRITNLSGISYGVPGTAAGDNFRVIWFDVTALGGTAAEGTKFGLYQMPSNNTLQADPGVYPVSAAFAGADSPKAMDFALAAVPEPSAALLGALGALGLLRRRRN